MRGDAQYTQKLVKAMENAEKEGNKDFKGFTKLMGDVETNFKLVAVECAKSGHTVYLPFNATSFTPKTHDDDKDAGKCYLTLSIYNDGFGYGTVPGYHGEN